MAAASNLVCVHRRAKKIVRGKRETRRKKGQYYGYDVLECRRVLNAAPVANEDLLYYTPVDTPLNVTTEASGLLGNDFDLNHDIGGGGATGGGVDWNCSTAAIPHRYRSWR